MMTNCPHCGSAAEPAFRAQDFNRRISDEWHQYYRCERCSLIFLSAIPANLAIYYPDNYYPIASSENQLESWAQAERYKLDIVERFTSRGRLLEIGPASGGFALLAKKAGFEVEVIEMDGGCCDFLNNVVAIHAIHSANERDALHQARDADVIALWHVIEHLPDPWSTLEAAVAKLRPNGILIIAAPNPDALQFRILGNRWTHIDAPRHVCLIPAALLIGKLNQLGMKALMHTTIDQGSLGWNSFGWEYSFASYFRMRPLKLLARAIGRLVAMLFKPIESREGKGSAYTLVFKKGVP